MMLWHEFLYGELLQMWLYIKYLEKGHSLLKDESVHGSIEGNLKIEKEVIDF